MTSTCFSLRVSLEALLNCFNGNHRFCIQTNKSYENRISEKTAYYYLNFFENSIYIIIWSNYFQIVDFGEIYWFVPLSHAAFLLSFTRFSVFITNFFKFLINSIELYYYYFLKLQCVVSIRGRSKTFLSLAVAIWSSSGLIVNKLIHSKSMSISLLSSDVRPFLSMDYEALAYTARRVIRHFNWSSLLRYSQIPSARKL